MPHVTGAEELPPGGPNPGNHGVRTCSATPQGGRPPTSYFAAQGNPSFGVIAASDGHGLHPAAHGGVPRIGGARMLDGSQLLPTLVLRAPHSTIPEVLPTLQLIPGGAAAAGAGAGHPAAPGGHTLAGPVRDPTQAEQQSQQQAAAQVLASPEVLLAHTQGSENVLLPQMTAPVLHGTEPQDHLRATQPEDVATRAHHTTQHDAPHTTQHDAAPVLPFLIADGPASAMPHQQHLPLTAQLLLPTLALQQAAGTTATTQGLVVASAQELAPHVASLPPDQPPGPRRQLPDGGMRIRQAAAATAAGLVAAEAGQQLQRLVRSQEDLLPAALAPGITLPAACAGTPPAVAPELLSPRLLRSGAAGSQVQIPGAATGASQEGGSTPHGSHPLSSLGTQVVGATPHASAEVQVLGSGEGPAGATPRGLSAGAFGSSSATPRTTNQHTSSSNADPFRLPSHPQPVVAQPQIECQDGSGKGGSSGAAGAADGQRPPSSGHSNSQCEQLATAAIAGAGAAVMLELQEAGAYAAAAGTVAVPVVQEQGAPVATDHHTAGGNPGSGTISAAPGLAQQQRQRPPTSPASTGPTSQPHENVESPVPTMDLNPGGHSLQPTVVLQATPSTSLAPTLQLRSPSQSLLTSESLLQPTLVLGSGAGGGARAGGSDSQPGSGGSVTQAVGGNVVAVGSGMQGSAGGALDARGAAAESTGGGAVDGAAAQLVDPAAGFGAAAGDVGVGVTGRGITEAGNGNGTQGAREECHGGQDGRTGAVEHLSSSPAGIQPALRTQLPPLPAPTGAAAAMQPSDISQSHDPQLPAAVAHDALPGLHRASHLGPMPMEVDAAAPAAGGNIYTNAATAHTPPAGIHMIVAPQEAQPMQLDEARPRQPAARAGPAARTGAPQLVRSPHRGGSDPAVAGQTQQPAAAGRAPQEGQGAARLPDSRAFSGRRRRLLEKAARQAAGRGGGGEENEGNVPVGGQHGASHGTAHVAQAKAEAMGARRAHGHVQHNSENGQVPGAAPGRPPSAEVPGGGATGKGLRPGCAAGAHKAAIKPKGCAKEWRAQAGPSGTAAAAAPGGSVMRPAAQMVRAAQDAAPYKSATAAALQGPGVPLLAAPAQEEQAGTVGQHYRAGHSSPHPPAGPSLPPHPPHTSQPASALAPTSSARGTRGERRAAAAAALAAALPDRPMSLLMRLVDDFVLVTTSRASAEVVVGRMMAGFPQ